MDGELARPLVAEPCRHEHDGAAGIAPRSELSGDQTGLDRFSEPHAVGNQHTCHGVTEHGERGLELVWEQSNRALRCTSQAAERVYVEKCTAEDVQPAARLHRPNAASMSDVPWAIERDEQCATRRAAADRCEQQRAAVGPGFDPVNPAALATHVNDLP